MADGRLSRTLAYYLVFVGFGLVLAALGPTLPALAELTGTEVAALSVIFPVRSGGYLLGVMFGGRLFDRFAGHPILALMLVGMIVCMGLVPLCTSLIALVVVLAVLGMVEGTLDVGANTLLTWLYPAKSLGPWMNGLHLLFGVGAFLSPLVVSFAMGLQDSVAHAYWLIAALLLPAVILVVVLPSPAIARHVNKEAIPLKPYRGTIAVVAGMLFAAVGAEVGFGYWIYSYAIELRLTSQTGAALLTSAFWGAFTFGRLLGVPLATRVSAPRIIAGAFVGCLCSAALPLLDTGSASLLWAGTILGGLAVAPMFATVLSLASGTMPVSGRVTGFFFVGSSTGGMTIPWIIGQLFEPVGPSSVFVVILVNLTVGMAIFVVHVTRRRSRATPWTEPTNIPRSG
ncbi:MAG: MFS transporter [Candidatus Latescibacterota bacterium]|nr:MFS transporter [Candidatus Latescibacterota bacterium]